MRMAINVRAWGGGLPSNTTRKRTDETSPGCSAPCWRRWTAPRKPRQIDEDQWREALSNLSGVYFDFQGTQLMSVPRSPGRGSNPALPDVGVRRLLLAENGAAMRSCTIVMKQTACIMPASTTCAAGTSPGNRDVLQRQQALFAYEGSIRPGPPMCSSANPAAMPSSQSVREIYNAANPVAEMSAGREDLLGPGLPLPVQQQLPPGTGWWSRVALHPEHSG